ncbi:conserved hypothetical protein [Sulfurivirga caldicuralii]|uniref:Purine nucleoside phosphorylase n=1 Tax=Sulfurivirga caldicuralii TaxID=364032 RepID=A0A1N6DSW8_9GAMM|nr:peptidoglycan editing factor PgeF [Sulfurivirga caldicuralii]SIN73876.1 conserved hypothetical protein [Sulfurivirga caldicuralii]
MGVVLPVIEPDWSAPPGVRACTTTRVGGVSAAPYDQLNLATHVGDAAESVRRNRDILKNALNLPEMPRFLEQVHSNCVVRFSRAEKVGDPPVADAAWTDEAGVVLAVLTADCLPIVLANRSGTVIAAIHAGWRGLDNGVIANTLDQLPKDENWLAWIGPGLRMDDFEVGAQVRAQLLAHGRALPGHFLPHPQPHKLWLDAVGIARWQLQQAGVSTVFDCGLSTLHDKRFFSYRRVTPTGRMATLVWRT